MGGRTRLVDLVGQRFNRLIVMARGVGPDTHRSYWSCRCDCGAVTNVIGTNLTRGHTRSCGCFKADTTKATKTIHGHCRNGRSTREFTAWQDAKNRCTRPTGVMWNAYGGRGIRMCDAWLNDFQTFLRDLGPCPDGYEIERKDVNGHYEPGNVMWIPGRLQGRNQRTNRMLTFRGTTQCMAAWADELGLSYKALRSRIARGWTIERAMTTPLRVWPDHRILDVATPTAMPTKTSLR